jgi:lysophospholipase L1-like esterase
MPETMNCVKKLKAGQHVTVVALGDSITEITFHTRGQMNWVGLLSEAIFEAYGAALCTMINAGMCGSTVREALGRLDRDVSRFHPDLVIVSFGMNDAGGGLDDLPTFRDEVRQLIGRIRQSRESEVLIRTPNPIVTVNGLPAPPEQPEVGQPWESRQQPVKAYAQALVELAGELECPVVDHYTLWANSRHPFKHQTANPQGLWFWMSDAIHPGPLGHMMFFRQLAPLFDLDARFPWE